MSLRKIKHPIDFKDFIARVADPLKTVESGTDLPKLSIVIPSYNQGAFIERTLRSIINQDYPHCQIIIIDGGSTDDTLAIIEKYQGCISYWVSESDAGQADALNKGFAAATGDIFGWQNSDDIYLPGAFREAVRVFNAHRKATVCYGNWYTIDEEDRVIDVHYALKPRMPHSACENIDAYNQTLFWRREAHSRFGKFDVQLHQKMDTDMIARLLTGEGPGAFYKTDAFLGAFRHHRLQKTDNAKMSEKVFAEEMRIEKKMGYKPAASLIGKYHRTCYRLAQFSQSFCYGGFGYTIKRLVTEYKRRGKFF